MDYFDALMSERPYHKAMSLDAALNLLQQESGKALDPRVVQTFIELYPQLRDEADASQDAPRQLTRVPSHAPAAQPAVGLVHESPAKTNVFEDIALAHREIYALYEIAQAMGSSLGVADTMALISTKLSNIVPFSCCALFLYNEESDTLRCRFATGARIRRRAAADRPERPGADRLGRAQPAAARQRPAERGLRGRGHSDAHDAAIRARVPARLQRTLHRHHRRVPHWTSRSTRDDHRRLLDRISEQAAAVINNSIVFEQTQEDSLTDPLTALPNTRFMFMHLTRELSRAGRLKTEVSLLVMDLDGFKDINDTYGHHVGDRALREVASVLRNGIRPYDICVRYAGDEFIVVLSGCGGEEAERKRRELQTRRRYPAVRGASRHCLLPLAISIGAAVFPHDGESYEALLATADGRMYRDKTRRKGLGDLVSGPTTMSEADIKKAAAGIL